MDQNVIAAITLLGVVAYGTYDLTNLATLRGWTAKVAVVDVVWGGLLTSVAATVAVLAARALT